MTLITQENEHDRLATRLSIILSRLFIGRVRYFPVPNQAG